MPTRKVPLITGYHYHIYNRGVDKREIFCNREDYRTFLSILRWYLREDCERPGLVGLPRMKRSLRGVVSLQAYVLMPNHFHFLMEQKQDEGITKFMQVIGTAYVMFFNRKYERAGALLQGRFQAKCIEEDESLLQVSKYIHRNPKSLVKKLSDYPYSSYLDYLREKREGLVDNLVILGLFHKSDPITDYRLFVEESDIDREVLDPLLFEE